jgi:ADP-heptose:LPS heptosyltransferase
MSDPGRVLFVRRGALGDTLLLTAVLRALRRHSPAGTELHFAGELEIAQLLVHAGVVEVALSREAFATWSPERAVLQLAGYERVIADDPAFAAVAPAGVDVQSYEPRPRDQRALSLQLADQLGLSLQWPQDHRLELPARAASSSVVAARDTLLLAPGSGAVAKNWPAVHWQQLAAAMHRQGVPIAVLVGPVERERDDPRRWPWPVPVAFVEPADTIELAHALAAARAFVGNDSGPAHLAAMLGVPTLALFGGGEPRVFAPIGPRAGHLQAPEQQLAALDAAVVASHVGTMLFR